MINGFGRYGLDCEICRYPFDDYGLDCEICRYPFDDDHGGIRYYDTFTDALTVAIAHGWSVSETGRIICCPTCHTRGLGSDTTELVSRAECARGLR